MVQLWPHHYAQYGKMQDLLEYRSVASTQVLIMIRSTFHNFFRRNHRFTRSVCPSVCQCTKRFPLGGETTRVTDRAGASSAQLGGPSTGVYAACVQTAIKNKRPDQCNLRWIVTVLVLRMAHRKWKEFKQQPSMLPGSAVPGSCLVSFYFLWAILSTSTVHTVLRFRFWNHIHFKIQ